MLEYLKALDQPYDILNFLPYEDGEGNDAIKIEAFDYAKPGINVDFSEMGLAWHIIIFRLNEDETSTTDHDFFDGILIEPREYISRMITDGWFGVIAKKTTTSADFAKATFDRIRGI